MPIIASNPPESYFAFPIRPDAGKDDLPVQKALLGDQFPRLGKQLGKALRFGLAVRVLLRSTVRLVPERNLHGIAKLPVEERIASSCAVVAVTKVKPVKSMNQRQERIERSRHFLHFSNTSAERCASAISASVKPFNDLHFDAARSARVIGP